MFLIELNVLYECRIEEANQHKTEKYADLAKTLRAPELKTKVYAVGVKPDDSQLDFQSIVS